jgi:formylglycine-generating enzyme required for sulfatase activity
MFIGELCWSDGILAPEVFKKFVAGNLAFSKKLQMIGDVMHMLEKCFERDPSRRPSMSYVAESLGETHRRLQIQFPEIWRPSVSGDGREQQPYENSLGMRFVPVTGTRVLFSAWPTRVQDYWAFVKTGKQVSWPVPSSPMYLHPAARVSWNDAKAFCEWLSKKDQRRYRLPTDDEWSRAVGLPKERGRTPHDNDGNIYDGYPKYPWGDEWPPPRGAGNYSQNLNVDDYQETSPVGAFRPNHFGLYDLGGNVWEWCEDSFDGWGAEQDKVVRGASWRDDAERMLRSSCRLDRSPRKADTSIGFRCVLQL